MRRVHIIMLTTVFLLVTVLLGRGSFVAAQEADFDDHPLVGTWLIYYPGPDDIPYHEMAMYFADGTAIVTTPDGSNGQGVWEPTGEVTAVATMSVVFEDGTRLLARVSIELAPDGQSFTNMITNEFFDVAGKGSGQIGPGNAVGTRIPIEAPGTPIASFDEYFGGDGIPEATPES